MHNLEFLRPSGGNGKCFDANCISDIEYFISVVKEKEVKPDLIASIITHYASKWLPELAEDDEIAKATLEDSHESITASWTKKRFFIQSLVRILPPEKDTVSCDFLLRLLRVANMVQVDLVCCMELEKRISWQLNQASLKELMIPSFSHTAPALLDVSLVLRLAKLFVETEEVSKSGSAVMKVAKLVDSYLAEAAVDSYLMLSEFFELASVLPNHARSTDDGLYRAIDTYLKAHPGLSKHERKALFNLINSKKLSQEAYLHAAQNERLPVRAVIQVLLSEQTKHQMDWSGSLSTPTRCFSKREMMSTQQMEIKKLKDDVVRLQSQCIAMQKKIDRLSDKKRGMSSYFSWKKLGIPVFKANRVGESDEECESAPPGLKTPLEMKARFLKGRRRSLS